MKLRQFICVFVLSSVSFTLMAQELDGYVVAIQSASTEAEGRLLDGDTFTMGKNGSKVHLWSPNSAGSAELNQQWKLVYAGYGKDNYYIVNQSPKAGDFNYLEVSWPDLGKDGGKVQLWKFNGGKDSRYGPNQVWKISLLREYTYSIASAHPKSNGKILDAGSRTLKNNGGLVQIYYNAENPNQLWHLHNMN